MTRRLALGLAVLAIGAILAFPLSLIVNKLDDTHDDTEAIQGQATQMTAILEQLTAIGETNSAVLCSFASFVLAEPVAQLVNEEDADFRRRLERYRGSLAALRRYDCRASLGPIFRREVKRRVEEIKSDIAELPPPSTGSGGNSDTKADGDGSGSAPENPGGGGGGGGAPADDPDTAPPAETPGPGGPPGPPGSPGPPGQSPDGPPGLAPGGPPGQLKKALGQVGGVLDEAVSGLSEAAEGLGDAQRPKPRP